MATRLSNLEGIMSVRVAGGPSESTGVGKKYAILHFEEFLKQATGFEGISFDFTSLTFEEFANIELWEQFGGYLVNASDFRTTDALMPGSAIQYFSGCKT